MKQSIETMNVTVNATSENVAPQMDAMRDAIIIACETGNKHAITNVEAAMSGAEPEDFSRWTFYVESLRQTAIEYGKVADNKDSAQSALELAKGRVWEKWRQILTVGEEDKVHPNLFTREHDADTVRVYACNMTTMNIPSIGTVAMATPSKVFRKMVETFLGLRMRANEALCDADRDVISAYLGAKNTIAKANERLNGRDTDDGHECGLLERFTATSESLEKSFEMLASFGISKDDALENPAIKSLIAEKDALDADITKAKKSISDAEKVMNEKQSQYDRIIATINKIERVAK